MHSSKSHLPWLVILLVVLALLSGCSNGGGTPVIPQEKAQETDNSGGMSGMASILGSSAGSDNYWQGTIELNGLKWVADLSPDGDIHRAAGEGIKLDGSIADFIDSHHDIFKISSSDLWLMCDEKHDGIRYVIYRQAYQGIPILDSRIDLRFGRGGSLVMLGADVFPELKDVPRPAVSRSSAESVAKSYHEGDVRECDIYIIHTVDNTFIPVWRTIVGDWLMLISALDGNVVEEQALSWNNDFEGNTEALVYYIDPNMGTFRSGLPDTRVRFQDQGNYDIYADETGAYHYSTDLYSEITTKVNILGRWINVNNAWHDDADITTTTYQDVPASFLFDTSNSDDSEANVYYWATVAHAYFKNIDPGFTGLDFRLTANVLQSPWCNAMASWNSINFYRPASPCINLGDIADVIIHEYGHVVTFRQYNSDEIPPEDLHEGFSDYFANTVTNQPLVGLNWKGQGTHIRNSDNNLYWPDNNCGGEGHCLGEYLAGALWDLRGMTGAETADHLWWFAKYGFPTTFPDFVTEICLVDDDNDNLNDGTPHYTEIWLSFENIHGIPVPDAPDYADLSLDVVPDVGNITISHATGGSFGYFIHVINNLPLPAHVEGWVAVKRPNTMWYGPIIPPSTFIANPVTLNFQANADFQYHLTQNIPAGLPTGGVFEYHVRLGDYVNMVTDKIIAEDMVTITIVP